jgi:uncharacterized protein (DUF1697 family)
MRYVALLRGINVGGAMKLSMPDLRALLESLGYSDVSTYIQSGNAIFTSPHDDSALIGREIEEGIAGELGLSVRVLIRTPAELAAIIEANPFPAARAVPTSLHVSFLSSQPDDQRLAAIDPTRFAPDQFRLGDRVIYLHYPQGSGRSKLTNDLLERRLGVTATARNWNTVTKLLVLANG